MDTYYSHFNIAGFTYYEGVDAFKDLQIGTELRLLAEPENKFDDAAVAIYHQDKKLGYVPKNKNEYMSKFLNSGHTDLFAVKVNKVSPAEHPEQQIGVVVKIKRKNSGAD
jgi:hypothetical protein